MLRKLLLTTAALAALTTAGNAAIVGNLGVNPTSATGAFSNQNLPTGSFADQWTFQLVGDQLLTIGSATNVYPQPTDFITGFNGSVFNIVGTVDANPGSGDDVLVLGPAVAVPGNCGIDCQVFGGTAILGSGNYYLNIAGIAGSSAGYGGDLAVVNIAAVPEPATWMMMVAGFFGIGGVTMLRRRRDAQFRLT
jgi:hypothetical protein